MRKPPCDVRVLDGRSGMGGAVAFPLPRGLTLYRWRDTIDGYLHFGLLCDAL